jgi:hypothetical protein
LPIAWHAVINQSTVNINQQHIMNYIAINAYRSSTSIGFANTWSTFRVTRSDRSRLLSIGLPTHDSASATVTGIRPATRSEIRAYRQQADYSGHTPTITRDANDNWTKSATS